MEELKYIGTIGEGYFCVVKKYRGKDSEKLYAIKELKSKHHNNDDYIYRFEREVRLTKQLRKHSNVINILYSVHDIENDKFYYITDFADSNLYNYIKKENQNLELIDRINIFEKIIDAISFAHDKGIIHRDIAPNNILVYNLYDEIDIKVSDFGLGKSMDSLSNYTTSSVSKYGQILYVAPEQKNKLVDASMESDVYSLGKLLYFILTGKDPDVIRDSDLSGIISKAISEDPSKRYESAIELKEEFLEYKSLLFEKKTKEIFSTNLSVREYIEFNDKVSVSNLWILVQEMNTSKHIFYDFIEPLYEYFDSKKLNEFFKYIGIEGIKKFSFLYSEAVNMCIYSTGWPFKRTSSIGAFAELIYRSTEIKPAKFEVFKVLWELGFGNDQWSVQDKVVDILATDIPINLVNDISVYIKKNGKRITRTGQEKLRKIDFNTIDDKLKTAIISVM